MGITNAGNVKISGLKREINNISIERMVETRGLSLEQKEKNAEKTLIEREFKTDEHKLNIFNEIENATSRKRAYKIAQMKIEKEKQLKRREEFSKIINLVTYNKTIINFGLALAITAAIGTAIYSEMQEKSKPVNRVAFDMVVNANGDMLVGNLLATEDKIGAQYFDETEDEELFSCLEKNNISREELIEAIEKVCNENDLEMEEVMPKIENDYSSFFNSKQK